MRGKGMAETMDTAPGVNTGLQARVFEYQTDGMFQKPPAPLPSGQLFDLLDDRRVVRHARFQGFFVIRQQNDRNPGHASCPLSVESSALQACPEFAEELHRECDTFLNHPSG